MKKQSIKRFFSTPTAGMLCGARRHAMMLLTTLLFALTAQTAWAWSGSGTSSSPYQITSTSDLLQLANDVYNGNTYSGKYFKLMNDLVFTTSISNWNAIAPTFASIGNDTYPFEGNFDGDNHTLAGVYIRRALNNKGDLYQGLFGVIGSGGVVKNIILTDSRIAASNYSAAIAGENRGSITNCHVTSTVTVSPQRDYINLFTYESCYVGGIAGNNASGATINNCSSGAKILTHEITTSNSSGDTMTHFYGGIAGGNSGSLTNCFALDVSIGRVIYDYGAITGYSNGTLANNYYADCNIWAYTSNAGTTTSGNKQVDITTNDGAVKACIITLSDYTTTSSAKVFTIPAHKSLSNGSLVSVAAVNYNLVKVGTTVTLGHEERSIDGYFLSNYSVKDADNGNVTVNGNTFTMPDKNVTATAVFTNANWTGSGSESSPYLISSPNQLILLSLRVNAGNTYQGKFFKLGSNIVFTKSQENNFTPIGSPSHPFAGHFDGNGKIISGINISLGSTDAVGLFGYAKNGATIKNLKLDDSTIGGRTNVGAILGNGEDNKTTIENCLVTSSVTVSGHYNVGGIVGTYATVRVCNSAATVKGYEQAGGIIGDVSYSVVTHNLYTGNSITTETQKYAGAIYGYKSNVSYRYTTFTDNYHTANNLGGAGNDNNATGIEWMGTRKAVVINKASGVTLNPTGTATTYNVSGITVYTDNSVIGYGGRFYAGDTENVKLNLSYNAPEGYVVTGYNDGNGHGMGRNSDGSYTLTMTAAAPTVTPDIDTVIKFDDRSYNYSNSNKIAANDYDNNGGKYVSVMLEGRTLYKDGKWNTIRLPFNVNITDPNGPLYGATIRTVIDASITGTTLNLTFAENRLNYWVENTLLAGLPYIIKWEKAEDYVNDDAHNIVNPVFTNVKVDHVGGDFCNADNTVAFIGTNDAITNFASYYEHGSDVLLLGDDNKLHYATDGASLGAFRAFFLVAHAAVTGNNAHQLTSFNIDFGDGEGETTGIITMSDVRSKMSDVWYTLDGRKLQGKPTQKGLYIVNGKTVAIK